MINEPINNDEFRCSFDSCFRNNVQFHNLRGLNIHLRRVHNENVEIKCSKCNKEFTDESVWQRHEQGCKGTTNNNSSINAEKQKLLNVLEFQKQLYDQIDSYLTLCFHEWLSTDIKDFGIKIASIIHFKNTHVSICHQQDKLLFKKQEITIEIPFVLKTLKQVIFDNYDHFDKYSDKLFCATNTNTSDYCTKNQLLFVLLKWVTVSSNTFGPTSYAHYFETQIKLGIREYFESLHKIESEHRNIR